MENKKLLTGFESDGRNVNEFGKQYLIAGEQGVGTIIYALDAATYEMRLERGSDINLVIIAGDPSLYSMARLMKSTTLGHKTLAERASIFSMYGGAERVKQVLEHIKMIKGRVVVIVDSEASLMLNDDALILSNGIKALGDNIVTFWTAFRTRPLQTPKGVREIKIDPRISSNLDTSLMLIKVRNRKSANHKVEAFDLNGKFVFGMWYNIDNSRFDREAMYLTIIKEGMM